MKKVVAVDFDGFLTSFGPTGRLKLPGFIYFLFLLIFNPKPNFDNFEIVEKLKDCGFRVVVLSARPELTRSLTKKWLDFYELEVDEIVLVGPGKVEEKKLSVIIDKEISYYFGDSLATINYLKGEGVSAFKC